MRDWNNYFLISAKNGDIKAFEKLIEPYEKRIYKIFLNTCPNEEDARLLAEEVFLSLYRSLSSIEKPDDIPVKIYKIAREVYNSGIVLKDGAREMAYAGKTL